MNMGKARHAVLRSPRATGSIQTPLPALPEEVLDQHSSDVSLVLKIVSYLHHIEMNNIELQRTYTDHAYCVEQWGEARHGAARLGKPNFVAQPTIVKLH